MKNLSIIVVVVIVIAGGLYYFAGNTVKAPAVDDGDKTTIDKSTLTDKNIPVAPVSRPERVIVTYSDEGFSPKDITVLMGTQVRFENNSSGKMWVASAAHPAHAAYDGTSLSQHCPDVTGSAFDECKGDDPGVAFSFSFNKEGVWEYHDHINPSRSGSITVTPLATSTTPGILY